MSDENNNTMIFLKGLITGAILGGLAALVFAPKSGKKFRKDISKKANRLIDDTNQLIENAGKKASGIISDARKKAEDMFDEGKKIINS